MYHVVVSNSSGDETYAGAIESIKEVSFSKGRLYSMRDVWNEELEKL